MKLRKLQDQTEGTTCAMNRAVLALGSRAFCNANATATSEKEPRGEKSHIKSRILGCILT